MLFLGRGGVYLVHVGRFNVFTSILACACSRIYMPDKKSKIVRNNTNLYLKT